MLAHDDLTPDQERLLRMMGHVIKANAGTLDGIESYRFTMPPFAGIGGRKMAEASPPPESRPSV